MARFYVREGNTRWGKILANFDTGDGLIREGNNPYGNVIAHVDGDRIRAGRTPWSTTLFSMTDGQIREGNGLLNKICGHLSSEGGSVLIREGATSYGTILANITDS